MNASLRRALMLDAFYQVVDNKIFRFLLFLVLGIVLSSFLIGFREDRIELVFGWQTLSYDDLLRSFGAPPRSEAEDLKGMIIGGAQKLIVEFFGGQLGTIFCIAATAFFLPRMLEKGSADIVFSKPVSRLKLLLSRYFAGLLFVSLLACLLVGGVYLGLLVGSGHNDPGFLWSALTLVYLFSLLHSVSTLIGVVTRSTVAAILITIVFFMTSGCVHGIWINRSWLRDAELQTKLREVDPEDSAGAQVDESDDRPAIVSLLLTTLDVSHYVLPKTSDAGYVSRKVRKALTEPPPELVDEAVRLTLRRPPRDFTRADGRQGEAADLSRAPAVWTASEDGRERARLTLSRRSRLEEDGKKRQSLTRATKAFLEELRASVTTPIEEERTAVDQVLATRVSWKADGRERSTLLFAYDDWLFELALDADPTWREPMERTGIVTQFVQGFGIARVGLAAADPSSWYESRFDWTAPLPYNVFFSIGSSVAFALAMLAVAWWRLSRIDF